MVVCLTDFSVLSRPKSTWTNQLYFMKCVCHQGKEEMEIG